MMEEIFLNSRSHSILKHDGSSTTFLYKIVDPFLLFYYGVYSPHRSRWSTYSKETKEKLIHDHAAQVFENCYRAVYPSASRYFEGKDIEIDCVRYTSERSLLVSEIKFRPINMAEKQRLEGRLRANFERSQLRRFAEKLTVDFEVVDLELGLKTLSESES